MTCGQPAWRICRRRRSKPARPYPSLLIRLIRFAFPSTLPAYVRERRSNLVIETTPADPSQLAASARTFRQAGYRVELLALAVRAADSRQGTAHRYAQGQRARPAHPVHHHRRPRRPLPGSARRRRGRGGTGGGRPRHRDAARRRRPLMTCPPAVPGSVAMDQRSDGSSADRLTR